MRLGTTLRKPAIALLLLAAFTYHAHAVNGIAVSIKGSAASTQMQSKGDIYKYVVSNNQSDYPGTLIYDGGDALYAAINQSGTKIAFNKSSDIVLMDINGGELTYLASAQSSSSVDFPDDNWVYFVKSQQWHRVSVTPNSSGEHVVEGNILATPSHAVASINHDGTQGAAHAYNQCGTNSAKAYGNHSFCKEGCGAGISISGRYMSHNTPSHQDLNIWDVTNGNKVHEITIHNFGYITEEHWNSNHFSTNSDEWLTFHQGDGYLQANGCRQVVYKIDGSVAFEIQPLRSGVYFEGNDFWAGDVGPADPFIVLDQAPLNFTAEAGGANPAAQTITVSNGGGGSLGQLSVSESAEWLTVAVDGYALTNSVDISGLDGSYSTTVTVSATGASNDKEYDVFLVVSAPPRLAEIRVRDKAVAPGESTQLTAVGYDQFGDPFTLGTVQWEVSGGGTIDAAGLFTAGSAEGSFTVTATSDGVSGTATVTVAVTPALHIKVNCGSNDYDVDGWERDDGYLDPAKDGADYSWSAISTDGVTNAAPGDVYRSVRHWDHNYIFPDLPDGAYVLRLHMADWSGGRDMKYVADGEVILESFDVATEAGGVGKALVKDVDITVTGGDGLLLECLKGGANDVFECGLEIFSEGTTVESGPITLLAPNGGEVWQTGETYIVSWECDTNRINGVSVYLSTTDGEEWELMSTGGSLPGHTAGTSAGSWSFVLPQSVNGQPVASNACRIKVTEYSDGSLNDVSDGVFTIEAGAVAFVDDAQPSGVGRAIRVQGATVNISVRGAHTIDICTVNGKLIQRIEGAQDRCYAIDTRRFGAGVYAILVHTADGSMRRALVPSLR